MQNIDRKRRDRILAINSEGETDITHFHNLDVEQLDCLLSEGFITPDGRQNASPSAGAFREFMQEWPEVHAFGYAVPPTRGDCRVTIEGVSCALGRVPEGRRALLAEAFRARFHDADEFIASGGSLYAWWD